MAREDVRISLSFKNNDRDRELYAFIKEKGEIIGMSSYIKQIIYAIMENEKEKQ